MPADDGSIDLDHLRQWIGRSTEAEDIATPALVERFCTTFLPHLASSADDETPLGLHWCLAPQTAAMSELGRDGHSRLGTFLPPVTFPRRMWAGGEIDFVAPIAVASRVVRRSVIADVRLKQGRSGPLCFVSVRHEYSAEGQTKISERQELVFRPQSRANAKPGTPLPQARNHLPRPDLVWTIQPSSVLLFRYSALTFNGHRIHYDQPYATNVEGYPGLLVHGPLQATLLLNAAAAVQRRAPRRFSYRNLAPIFSGTSFQACAARTSDGQVECWIDGAGGTKAMLGTATA